MGIYKLKNNTTFHTSKKRGDYKVVSYTATPTLITAKRYAPLIRFYSVI